MKIKKQIELALVVAIATTSIPVGAASGSEAPALAEQSDAIRPFHINVPEEALVDLRRRIAETRWPDREIVTDQSQGVQLATMQELVRYWGRNTIGARPRRS